MIHIYCKNMTIENQEDYDHFIHKNEIRLHAMPCPKCGCTNCLIFYGTHPRYFINENGNHVKIKAQRCHCKECHSTHLILPYFFLPCFLYTLFELKALSLNPSDSIIDDSYCLRLHKRLPFNLLKSTHLFYKFYLFLRSAFKIKPFPYSLVKVNEYPSN